MALVLKPHSRRDLTKFRDGRRKHMPQIDTAGKHRITPDDGAVNTQIHDRTHIGEHSSAHMSMSPAATLNKPPKPKDHGAVPVHGSTHHNVDGRSAPGLSRTQSEAALQGFATEADPRSPLTGASKRTAAAPAGFGMRSRADEVDIEDVGAAHKRNVGKGVDHDLAKAILAEAKRN